MRRSVTLLLTSLGVLLVLFGSVCAAVVGPDDTVMVGEKQVPERAKGLAVRTHPAITDFVNIDMLVRAEAEGGVFVGSSHRVDTDDLLTGWRYFEVTRMRLGHVGGVVTEGRRATRRTLRPATLVGWRDRASGDREAEVVVNLDGTPVDVVAVPHQRDARVTLSIGAHVGGAFWTQVALAVTGLVMLVAAAVLRRLRPRGGPIGGGSARPGVGVAGRAGVDDAPTLSLPKYPSRLERRAGLRSGLRSGSGRTPRRWPLLPAVPLALVLVTGCAVPGPAPQGDPVPTRTGMRLVEGQELDAATSAVYAPEFAAYPMWALVGTSDPSRVRLMTREAFSQPWRTEARVRLRGELPGMVERVIEPNDVLARRADEAAVALGQWWSTGQVEGIRVDRRTQRLRDELLASGAWPSAIWAVDPLEGTPRVRVVEVSGGHLVVVRHTLMTPTPRRLTMVVSFPAATRPVVLGTSLVEDD